MTVGRDRPFRTMRRLVELRRPVVHAVAGTATLADAAALLAGHRVDAVAVRDDDALHGVVSRACVAAAAARHPDTAPCGLRAVDAAETVPSVDLDTTVPDALARLAADGPDHVAVVDAAGRIVDLVSRADLLAEMIWHQTEVIREMTLQDRLMHLQGVYSC